MRSIAFVVFYCVCFGNTLHAYATEKPKIVLSTDGSCKAILQTDDFFEINNETTNLSFDWSGQCRDGFINGGGKFTLYSGEYILDIQNFGENQGVEFEDGVIYKSSFDFFDITKSEIFSVGPGLLSCSANNAQRFGVYFKDDVNIDSKRFLIEFTKWFEENVNSMCRLTPGQKARFDVYLNSGGNCNYGTCTGHYRIKARFNLNVGESGYVELDLENAFASNGRPITSRYNDEIYNLNLPARRNDSKKESAVNLKKSRTQNLDEEQELKNTRARNRRELLEKASSDEMRDKNCVPIPQEYEIIHEVTKGDFRSSGEFYDFASCQREREKLFKGSNAMCMQFLDARIKVSPETRAAMEEHKRKGKMCL